MIAFDLTAGQAQVLITSATRKRAEAAVKWDRDAVRNAAREGLQIRVVVDGTGVWLDGGGRTRTSLYPVATFAYLESKGILKKEAAV